MDAIRSYIDHMFRSLPETEEVRQARLELQQICEDRYHELRGEGVSEHEAVGRVITQFGDLDEVADELGIRSAIDDRGEEAEGIELSREDAERFLRSRRSGSRLIALGVFVILLGISTMIAATEAIGHEGEEPPAIALILLFMLVAGAVALFIVGGMSIGQFRRYEDRALRLDPATAEHYRALRAAEQGRFTASIATGVVVIILGMGLAAIGGVLQQEGGPEPGGWLLACMPAVVGIGTGVIIVGSIRRGSLDRLTSEGDCHPERSRANQLISRIAGPYWLLALLVFLAWGFIGEAWDRSWMVWPIGGVLFAAIAITIESFWGDHERRGDR